MGKMSRDKGAAGERELAAKLQEYGIKARRGQQFSGSPDSPDVVTELKDIHIECKRVEALSIYPAMEQAENDCGEHKFPVVMHRRSRRQWLAIMNLCDWAIIVKKAELWDTIISEAESGDPFDEEV